MTKTEGVVTMERQLNNIGTTIKMIREAKNIKQYVLQAALKNTCNLSKLEANKTQVSLITFHEILQLLDISIDEFFMFHSTTRHIQKPYYETITDYLTYHAPRVDAQYVRETCMSLSLYADESLQNVQTIKLKLLYHRLSCFYYLNFERNKHKAHAHSAILLDYYKNVINLPLLSDLNLLPMILPFVSLKEGQSLLTDFDFVHRLQQDKHYRVQNIYLHAQLTFAKRCFQERHYLLFRDTLANIDFFINNFPTVDVYAELLILKGIYFYDFESDTTRGEVFMSRGLKLADEFQLSNIYRSWNRYCKNTYKK